MSGYNPSRHPCGNLAAQEFPSETTASDGPPMAMAAMTCNWAPMESISESLLAFDHPWLWDLDGFGGICDFGPFEIGQM